MSLLLTYLLSLEENLLPARSGKFITCGYELVVGTFTNITSTYHNTSF